MINYRATTTDGKVAIFQAKHIGHAGRLIERRWGRSVRLQRIETIYI